MNSASRIYMKESYVPTWHKVYDMDSDSCYYRNDETQQNSWYAPKKLKSSTEDYIPIEKFISTDSYNLSEPTFLNHLVSLPPNLNLMSKCHKCDTEHDVRKHGYCGRCFAEINSYQEPLVEKYKIKCQGCHAWGLNLIKDDGFCSHCRYNLEHGLEIKVYDNTEEMDSTKEETFIIKCKGCGGWGKDLVKENGKCNHCTLQEEKLQFEAKWKTQCKTCGGWGLDLVGEDGLCNHCRRQFESERIFFSRVLDQTPKTVSKENMINHPNFQAIYSINDTILGKRSRKDDPNFDF